MRPVLHTLHWRLGSQQGFALWMDNRPELHPRNCALSPAYSGSSLLVAGVQRTSSWCPSSASCRDTASGPLISAAWLGYQSRWHLLLLCFRPISACSPPGLWPGTHSHPHLILVFTHLLILGNTHWPGPFASEKDEGWVLGSSPI